MTPSEKSGEVVQSNLGFASANSSLGVPAVYHVDGPEASLRFRLFPQFAGTS